MVGVVELLLELPKENGPGVELDRGPAREEEFPGKLLLSVSRASKSAPEEPSPVLRSTVAGRKI